MMRFGLMIDRTRSHTALSGLGAKYPPARRMVALSLVALLLTGLSTQSALADLYRWTSPNGDMHYSDNMPSAQAERGYDLINPATGEVLKHFKPAKTPAEIAAEQAAKQARLAASKAQAEQAQKDQMLLSLYSSAADLIRARNQRLAELDGLIQQNQDAISRAWKRGLSHNAEEASAAQKDGAQLRQNLATLEDQRDRTARQFAQDEQRLNQLLAKKPTPPTP